MLHAFQHLKTLVEPSPKFGQQKAKRQEEEAEETAVLIFLRRKRWKLCRASTGEPLAARLSSTDSFAFARAQNSFASV